MANNYSIPALEKESAYGIQQVSLITDAFTNRRLFLLGEIDQNLVFSFTMQMLSLVEDSFYHTAKL